MNKIELMFVVFKSKNNNMECSNSLESTKSSHFPPREVIVQLSQKKRAIWWSISYYS